MKKVIFFLLLFVCVICTPVQAKEYELRKCHTTAYCLKGITASGCEVRDGICAGPKEWLGSTIIVYQRLPGNKVGKLIGIYECLDIGGSEAIQEGRVIDIYQETYEDCKEFMKTVYEDNCEGKIFIQIIDSEDVAG